MSRRVYRARTVDSVPVSPEMKLKAYADLVDSRLAELLPPADEWPSPLSEAMRYSCLAPGKRLRPALCMASAVAVGASAESVLDAACAIEMVHAFSLVHDDLPAIDNDELRRGRPTCHVKFGEAVAILAGDALFALAFRTVALGPWEARGDAVGLLAEAAIRLVRGETADVLAEGQEIDEAALEFIHESKTGALIAASCEIGALLGGASRETAKHLAVYGDKIGLAFQIVDDILNETSTAEQLGKAAGSDRERGKATYPALHGLEAARQHARDLVEEALRHLDGLTGDVALLRDLAAFSLARVR